MEARLNKELSKERSVFFCDIILETLLTEVWGFGLPDYKLCYGI